MSAACACEALPSIESLRPLAAELFREAVRQAMAKPRFERPLAYVQMLELIPDYEAYGFRCGNDAQEALVPRDTKLTWYAWSEETIVIRGFRIEVKVHPFSCAGHCVHVRVQTPDRSPLPFTDTGYQSLFVNFAVVADYSTPYQLIEELFPAEPIQVGLF